MSRMRSTEPVAVNTYGRRQPIEIPITFPNSDSVIAVMECMWDEGGPFQHILDCGGVRYNFLVEYNEDVTDCAENVCLKKIYRGLKLGNRKLKDEGRLECRSLSWSLLATDQKARVDSAQRVNPTGEYGTEEQSVKIQIKTIDGALRALQHDCKLLHTEPIENTFPNVRVFKKGEIEYRSKLFEHMYKVKVDGHDCCIKALLAEWVGERDFRREIHELQKLPSHPNVVHLVGLVDAGDGKIDGLVLLLISGTSLDKVKLITNGQREKWKREISNGVRFLHENDVIWGDINPGNIMLDGATERPVLIDFGGGRAEEGMETKEGDLKGLQQILDYLDNIPLQA
eukprot:Plantae.Rhodophyta-Hildenbrandia_rubra.ctg10356.p1 GENE.Plantae.Rhodophyta-Hildenbrandia_rubra.ctg10356~~Plantae.Rhodophyta-Hildenbrandia_rubra.ctg10356.p1  ORF type:complete len:341 (+),score=45.38 Plantae.Rhodophyta-Hildenbrandia_rubra.ctg10356:3057-4079(+)